MRPCLWTSCRRRCWSGACCFACAVTQASIATRMRIRRTVGLSRVLNPKVLDFCAHSRSTWPRISAYPTHVATPGCTRSRKPRVSNGVPLHSDLAAQNESQLGLQTKPMLLVAASMVCKQQSRHHKPKIHHAAMHPEALHQKIRKLPAAYTSCARTCRTSHKRSLANVAVCRNRCPQRRVWKVNAKSAQSSQAVAVVLSVAVALR